MALPLGELSPQVTERALALPLGELSPQVTERTLALPLGELSPQVTERALALNRPSAGGDAHAAKQVPLGCAAPPAQTTNASPKVR